MASDLVFGSACLCFFIVGLANEGGLAQTAKSLDILTKGVLDPPRRIEATTELVAASDSMLKVGLSYSKLHWAGGLLAKPPRWYRLL